MPEIALTVAAGQRADPVRVDSFTRDLHRELRRIPGVVTERAAAPLPEGAKAGELAFVGSLILSALFSAKTLDAAVRLIAARIQATAGWSVTLRHGDTEVTMTGQIPDHDVERAVRVFAEVLAVGRDAAAAPDSASAPDSAPRSGTAAAAGATPAADPE
ncbi:MAG: hypothetical protein ACRDTU_17665 [Micromonosporaceae bacterium]